MSKFIFGRGLIDDLTFLTLNVGVTHINAIWSVELAQDIQAFHNMDAEAELTALLSENIAREIDREIIRELRLSNRYILENIFNIRSFKFGR